MGGPINANDKTALLRKIFKEFAATGAPTLLIDTLTEDAVYSLSVGPGTPLSGEFRGKEGVAHYF